MVEPVDDPVRFDVTEDAIATLTMNRAPLNIFDLDMRDGFIAAVGAARDIPDVRALIIRAEGKHFSAGADLREFGTAESIHEARRIRWDRDPWGPLWDLPMPTIAAMHGFAVGAGFEFALLCDFRLATPDTQLALPETRLAMLPSAGGTQSLTRLLGPHGAFPIVATAQHIDAQSALAEGLVHRVVDDVDAEAMSIARRIAALDPGVVRAARRAIHAAGDLDLEAGCRLESDLARVLAASPGLPDDARGTTTAAGEVP